MWVVWVDTYEAAADLKLWEVFANKSADIHESSQLIHYHLLSVHIYKRIITSVRTMGSICKKNPLTYTNLCNSFITISSSVHIYKRIITSAKMQFPLKQNLRR